MEDLSLIHGVGGIILIALDFTIRRCYVHRFVMLHLHLYCIYLIVILLYHLHARMLHVRQRRLRILLQVNVCESYAYVL